MKNPYTEPLELFSFDEIVGALDAVSDETGRLDFKEEMIAKTELAYRACSFANAEGGLIVVGIKDPVAGRSLEFGKPAATDDKERLRVSAQINSRVYPALAIETFGYRSSDNSKAIMVIRIPRSDVAPHEYTEGDKHNLPVRRGTATGRLTLPEIELLRLRRSTEMNDSPLVPKANSLVNLSPMNDRDGFVGVVVRPAAYSSKRRIMDIDDDHLCFGISEATRGADDMIHGELELKGSADSNVLLSKGWAPHQGAVVSSGYGPDYLGPPVHMEIYSDGDIVIRISQTAEDPFKQFVYALLMAYAAAQEVFYNLAVAPEACFHVISRFDARRGDFPGHLPQAYEDRFDVNLSSETFADAFLNTVMRLFRAGDGSSKRDIVRNILDEYSRAVLPLGDELRPRWLTSSG
jgi:hypothetical protein